MRKVLRYWMLLLTLVLILSSSIYLLAYKPSRNTVLPESSVKVIEDREQGITTSDANTGEWEIQGDVR